MSETTPSSRQRASETLVRFMKDRLVAPSSLPVPGVEPDCETALERLIEVNRLEPLMHTLRAIDDERLFSEETGQAYRAEAYRRMLFGNHQVRHAVEFAQALEAVGIPCICMRGPFASQDLYGDPGVRPYNDIDLLVPREQAMDAWRVAVDLGYELFSADMPLRYFLRHHLHWQLRQPAQNVICDLHWAVEHPYRLYRIDYPGIFAQAQRVTSSQGGWSEPAVGHHLILTALHIRKHLEDMYEISQQQDGLLEVIRRGELLHVIDLALLIQRQGGTLDWDQLLEDARQWNALEALAGSLALVEQAFSGLLPEAFLTRVQAAVPAWQVPAASAGLPRQRSLQRMLGATAKRGGFRASKLQDAWAYIAPPREYFGARPSLARTLRRMRHHVFAAGQLVFVAVDTALATGLATFRGSLLKRKTS